MKKLRRWRPTQSYVEIFNKTSETSGREGTAGSAASPR